MSVLLRGMYARCGSAWVALVLALAAPAGLAATLQVDDDPNSCTPKDGSETCPYQVIQDAIDAAVVGDQVLVLPGVYLEWIFVKNGVDVVSRDGPEVTTIDATGQNFAAVRFSNTSPGSTLVSTLSGFTITGGTGRPRPTIYRGGLPGASAGAGIFIYNRNKNVITPVVSNNIITGNNLVSSDLVDYPFLLGAGIYVAVGAPLITHNEISANTAVDVNGEIAYGGALYNTAYARPILTHNSIVGNEATHGGGGLQLQGPLAYIGPAVVDGNLIEGNTTLGTGAGISVGAYANAEISNNVIRGNDSSGIGGGVFTYYANVTLRNNTIVGNTATWTGGIWIDKSDASYTIAIHNNIITGNSSTYPARAGGIEKRSGAESNAVVEFSYNDLVGNLPSDFQGISDPALSPGNIAGPPAFVDPAGGNFRLQPGSPGIDVGSSAFAPPIDFDQEPRPLDGSGDNVPEVDMGAFELLLDLDGDGVPDDGSRSGVAGDAPCTGGVASMCDDNCAGVQNPLQEDPDADSIGSSCDVCPDTPDPLQEDLDGDGAGDACDPDIDGDLVDNGLDCAPAVISASEAPGEVSVALAPVAQLSWPAERQSNVYNVYRMSRDPLLPFAYDFACVASEVPETTWSELEDPPAGFVYLYLVSGVNPCDTGPLGFDAAGVPRPAPSLACVPQNRDSDGDTITDVADNCALTANVSQADSDLDGLGNACDVCALDPANDADADGACADVDNCPGVPNALQEDGDGDLAGDACDCAPADPSASALPTGVVTGLMVDPDLQTLTWDPDPAAATYDVFQGTIGSSGGFSYGHVCLAQVGTNSAADPTLPATGEAFYYEVASSNACGSGSLGAGSGGMQRPNPGC